MRLKILAFCDYYLPGYKAGGPIKSISNLVDQLGEEIQFQIVTRDRDWSDDIAYPHVEVNAWQRVGDAEVLYLTPEHLSLLGLRKVIASQAYDVLYLNSFFSSFSAKIVMLRRFRMIPPKPLVLAPRGEFARSALSIKAHKKRPYLLLARLMGLYQGVMWHLSSEQEQADVLSSFAWGNRPERDRPRMVIARNLFSRRAGISDALSFARKPSGILRVVFLSRISRMKNLDGALRMLRDVRGNIELDIYGPFSTQADRSFWSECQQLIRGLPDNIKVEYGGSVESDRVVSTLGRYDLFFLPTHGENFGHIILEALTAGCPVLISNRTPWRNLEMHGAGWNLPLEQPENFTAVLQRCVDMDAASFGELRHTAYRYARKYLEDKSAVEQNRALFHCAAAGSPE